MTREKLLQEIIPPDCGVKAARVGCQGMHIASFIHIVLDCIVKSLNMSFDEFNFLST